MNIILIGMPGCGKTTIGRIVSRKMKRDFVDMDKEIERAEGRKINDIFAQDGEGYFRDAETRLLKSFSGGNNVISTGGGIVVRDENIELLKSGGACVIFIDRPLDNIVRRIKTKDRPLLAQNSKERLEKLYAERYDKYVGACNIRIVNDKSLYDAVNKLISEAEKYENNCN